MKVPEYDGDDFFWVASNAGQVAEEVFGADDPNKYLESLEDWRRKLFHVSQAVMGIMNGGVDGYIRGGNGDEVDELLIILIEIGANEMAKTISDARAGFPDSLVPRRYEDRVNALDGLLAKSQARRLDDLIDVRIDDNIWSLMRSLAPTGAQ